MTRLMYDSVNVNAIPADAQMVAGYVSGRYKNFDKLVARFPRAICVPIATRANVNDGIVLDVEPYDATPDQAPAWVMMRREAGFNPTVYTMASWLTTVRNAFHTQGVVEPPYWVAKHDNKPIMIPGAVAKQYGGVINQYDLSIVADYWPGVDMTPEQAKMLQEIHDAIYKGHPEIGQPGMEGTLTETWIKVTGK